MYEAVPDNVPKDILGPTDNLGADALKLSVGEALGLSVDYYVLINLRGFETLVNALGGVTVNVNSYVPIGGNIRPRHPAVGVPRAGPEPEAERPYRRSVVRPRPLRLETTSPGWTGSAA